MRRIGLIAGPTERAQGEGSANVSVTNVHLGRKAKGANCCCGGGGGGGGSAGSRTRACVQMIFAQRSGGPAVGLRRCWQRISIGIEQIWTRICGRRGFLIVVIIGIAPIIGPTTGWGAQRIRALGCSFSQCWDRISTSLGRGRSVGECTYAWCWV